jgi:hypothetical protein
MWSIDCIKALVQCSTSMTKRFGHGTCKFGHGTLFYDQLMTKLNWSLKLRHIWSTMTNMVILVIEVELFHDQHVFRHRSVFLLWPSQMVPKLVTEGDATWHGPCWLLTWQGTCWHGYDDVALWHSATCRVAICPRVELWRVHLSHSGLSTCRTLVCPRVALWLLHVSLSGWSTWQMMTSVTWQMT